MAAEPNAVEQAVSRTLRDNLEKIQRSVDELHQAVNDLSSACASSRAGNALPPMVRAQTCAASLSATLEVLSRLVTSALQPPVQMPQLETETPRVSPSINFPPPPVNLPVSVFEQPPLASTHPIEHITWAPPAPVAPVAPMPMPSVADIFQPVEPVQAILETPPAEATIFSGMSPAAEISAPVQPAPETQPELAKVIVPVTLPDPEPDFDLGVPVAVHAGLEAPTSVERAEAGPVFDLDLLAPDEQELHRRAFRVAKVSMQDIKMLRPEDVRAGRENKDLCFRLRDDIEKAHKEYGRRFQSIQSHPVDYFYDWMVEILGGGDPQTLGEYPYPSAVLRR
ncbi:MAG TPA: hypothetical protein VG272_07845 [Candidatus Acidoferrales bacterium]|jgi:uncharacterized damage-inducible protein DinB|nr:hypothetical protein [Candidatus Acidoferrales bacterium]